MEAQNLKELLTHRLYIPEIQREYVWGAEENIDKLIRFVEDVVNAVNQDEDKNVGFLYSYEVHRRYNKDSKEDPNENLLQVPLYSEHYIIDGQQRFTTLVLLLYVVALREDRLSDFQEILKSTEPTIQFSYNVRPLTEHFFRLLINQNKCLQNVKENIWYTHEFERDMTITSMVNAIAKIDAYLDAKPHFNELYESILKHVKFWYFDVKQTSQGEELYITMNSRGEKLTESEQIKPHLFEKLPKDKVNYYGKLWDNWEEYFFKYRPTDCGDQAIRYVDIAMNNFIRIISELLSLKEQNEIELTEKLSLPVLEKWFNALKRIPADDIFKREIHRLYSTKEDARFFVLKSLLVTAMRQPDDQREYFRVRATMRNNVIRRKVTNHIPLLKFLKNYLFSPLSSFYEFILSGVDSEHVLASNEIQKIRILQDVKSLEIEDLFWEDEHHCIWSGDISAVIEWAMVEDGQFSFILYKQYSEKFKELFKHNENELKSDAHLDLVRRAILTLKFDDYPNYYHSWKNCSFAYEPGDWKQLFTSHKSVFKIFFTQLLNDDADKVMLSMIEKYDIADNYSEFVKEPYAPELLRYCQYKNFQWSNNSIILISREKASGPHANIHAYKYYLRVCANNFEGWQVVNFYPYGDTCVFFNQLKNINQLAIDLYWDQGKDGNKMKIQCFMRDASKLYLGETYLSSLIKNGYTWDTEVQRYSLYIDTPEDEAQSFIVMDEYLKKIMQTISNLAL